MSEGEHEKLEDDEKCDSLTDEEIEVPEDEIHDKNEGDDRQPKEVWANVDLQDISVKYSTIHRIV
jgi:hypothetical protein